MCTAWMKGLRDKSLMKNFKGIILSEIRVLVLVSLEMGICEVCGAKSGRDLFYIASTPIARVNFCETFLPLRWSEFFSRTSPSGRTYYRFPLTDEVTRKTRCNSKSWKRFAEQPHRNVLGLAYYSLLAYSASDRALRSMRLSSFSQ